MSGEELKAKAASLPISAGTRYEVIQKLIIGGALDKPKSSAELVATIRETVGKKWRTAYVQTYMKKFLLAGIVRAVRDPKGRQNFWVLTCVTREEALKALGKSRKIGVIEEDLFSSDLVTKLRRDCGHELEELRDNFGRNGNCSAFLLRKILEKLIIIVFSKNNKEHQLEDKGRPGGWKGLQDMIGIASLEKLHGIPFLIPRTARELSGIKFLGDTAAHNPLVGVDMASIVPQMPFIVTAYKELAERL